MTTNQLCHRLALERCRMYLAQLCAASHLEIEDVGDLTEYMDVMAPLLKGLGQDLDVLEKAIG